MKKVFAIILTLLFILSTLTACSSKNTAQKSTSDSSGKTELVVFAAASMTSTMKEFEEGFEAANTGIDIVLNTDSSGALLTQILEGAPCDIFFSAAQKQTTIRTCFGFFWRKSVRANTARERNASA